MAPWPSGHDATAYTVRYLVSLIMEIVSLPIAGDGFTAVVSGVARVNKVGGKRGRGSGGEGPRKIFGATPFNLV